MTNGNPDQCEECDESRGFYLFVRNPVKTQCAYKITPSVDEDPLQVEYCQFDFSYYPPDENVDPEIISNLKIRFVAFKDENGLQSGIFKSYCFSPELYGNVSATESICSKSGATNAEIISGTTD